MRLRGQSPQDVGHIWVYGDRPEARCFRNSSEDERSRLGVLLPKLREVGTWKPGVWKSRAAPANVLGPPQPASAPRRLLEARVTSSLGCLSGGSSSEPPLATARCDPDQADVLQGAACAMLAPLPSAAARQVSSIRNLLDAHAQGGAALGAPLVGA